MGVLRHNTLLKRFFRTLDIFLKIDKSTYVFKTCSNFFISEALVLQGFSKHKSIERFVYDLARNIAFKQPEQNVIEKSVVLLTNMFGDSSTKNVCFPKLLLVFHL